ncbi:peptidase M48 Ste24p [Stutzerimonas nosocomialis]|uniref:M48 family metallopeptidase n=1 Tax=Stutzerimonas nosocomialis TaxID=1056496 RepID=UPI001107A854|nr:M48 family metallopeptidase [Stutzerimonas nosocomialis]TLX54750.1 peptidase M48 Ste24p [Stutzerimonas nosocomialis]
MNFFEQQARAKRNSGRLIMLLALAVTGLIALASLALGFALRLLGHSDSHALSQGLGIDWWLIGSVSVVVIGVVVLGSLFKSVQLSRGGKAVAERLGGRLINLGPRGFEERRLLNVVEEMAIASGTPVPPVYVLDDASINAFAAGLTPQDAVIGITRGAITLLTREELQGVIAHEFSHIFHGDMRLNTRLVSVLHGILLLGLIGEFVLRGGGRSSRSRSNRGNGVAAVLLIGGSLMVIGYAGTFFGNLIKAAVSRQREFLADAAAVQFTRDPSGIAGALKKIGGHLGGSRLQSANAAEFSHMYFGQGVSAGIAGLMATHPPLPERIRRVEPGWDGQFPYVDPSVAASPFGAGPGVAGLAAGGPAAELYGLVDAERAIATIGDPQPAHLQAARDTLDRLPPMLVDAAHRCHGAEALVYGLLIDADPAVRERQFDLLETAPSDVRQVMAQLVPALDRIAEGQRLALLELAIPVLKQLEREGLVRLKQNLGALILADRKVSLMEWSLLRIVERNIAGPRWVDGRHSLEAVRDEVAVLLSALALAGHDEPDDARKAFDAAQAELPFVLTMREGEAAGLKALDAALKRLVSLKPLQKPRLLKAMARCIGHDGRIRAAEAELMRAVADSLDCPMPPLLAP